MNQINFLEDSLQKDCKESWAINMILVSYQGCSDIRESPPVLKNGDYDIWYSPVNFCHNFSSQVYAVPFQWRLLIFIRKKPFRLNRRSQWEANPSKKLFSENNWFCQSNLEEQRKNKNNREYTDQSYRPENSMCIFMFIK